MIIVDELRSLNTEQRSAFIASLLGWTLDAFDFFLLTFVVKNIATDFHVQVSLVALAITLTLMMRPLGAFVFGWLADRFGRRPVLMADVLLYSAVELATAFAPDLTWFLGLRLLFGFAMGGEWGIGASLAMEHVPPKARGVVSGILQEGYAFGYLLAALVNFFVGQIGWRGMFVVGVLPALLVLYIRRHVRESPAFEAVRARARAARAAPPPPPELPAQDRGGLVVMHLLVMAGALPGLLFVLMRPPLAVLLASGLPVLAGVGLAYRARRRSGLARSSHAVQALWTFWLAIAAAVIFALVLFSISKALGQLGVPLCAVIDAGLALAAVWFIVRGAVGLWQVGRGQGFPPADPDSFFGSLGARWGLLLYVVVLMTAFNAFSHGTQDLYPTFLKVQHRFDPAMVSTLTIVLNLGAIAGGLIFGALSERIGRRRAIALAALLALPAIPLWAGSSTPLMLGLGAFLIQIAVQGAWGVVPVHLNELSPDAARGGFPGVAYQLGNLIAAGNAVIQANLAEARHDDYGFALGVVAAVVAVVLAALALFGPERRGAAFGGG